MRDDRLGNPHRIGLTDAERAVFVPGCVVKTDGVKNLTMRHMNLTRSLADVYVIVQMPNGTVPRGPRAGEMNYHWVWKERDA